ncbi:DUF500-domain-containing protein [Coemansia reversa NRRL 1564]|uniref:DUF500-domain-containing protein n=1 Tax=Coemansia reversa (strain ATCC 12441 / NRRL 1564) TaxID=763665 RepID=A0A2G5BJU3_COERN|nr:DUF500-domain-containing protein [Coemansia reversa NRRL 1564]|eukprot:PIA19285.1 DUF500-domain-containing protein [Coemansia reversa NRRL 1564]
MTFDLKSRMPIPMSLETECKKGARIIESFLKPGGLGTDRLIPPSILEQAKGIAFLSVIKGGFIWSGRLGSGLVVARLPNGSWSAPSAISIGGAGVGGQVGGELTDFVMILTTPAAVKSFSHGGNLTLGANLGIAAGPFGRSAEASGAVRNLAPVLSYSRTKGLFIGISLEGTVLVERKGANKDAYGKPVRPQELLEGLIPPPPIADVLYRALNLRIPPPATSTLTAGEPGTYGATSFYGDSAYGSAANDNAANNGAMSGYGASTSAAAAPVAGTSTSYLNRSITDASHDTSSNYGGGFSGYGKMPASPTKPSGLDNNHEEAPKYSEFDRANIVGNSDYYSAPIGDSKATARRPPPPIPNRARPDDRARATAGFDYEPDEKLNPDDLRFKKGDIIIITERGPTLESWWRGSCNGKEGQFPANYLDEDSKKRLGF